MALNPDALMAHEFPVTDQRVSRRDCLLYAVSLGLGHDPLDPFALRYAYEGELRVFPSMPVILGHPGVWMDDPALGITRSKVVFGSQSLTNLKPIVPGAVVTGTNRIVEVVDKGRGAMITLERKLQDAGGELLALMHWIIFCRGDGGFGGQGVSRFSPDNPVAGPPQQTVLLGTRPEAALLYRLNGDYNPLHADPAHAARVGFERPILHGLCTYGMAARAIQQTLPERALVSIDARFSGPVTPGDTLAFDLWIEGDVVLFQGRVQETGTIALDNGRAVLG